MSEIDDYLNIVEAQMNKGVSRLKVTATESIEDGDVKEIHHHGRCDVGSPWAKGTVTNCDAVDVPSIIDSIQ